MSLHTDLISYWKLNETIGTRNDSHGTNHLADNNTVGYATGKISNAADFEADNSEYLSLTDNTDLSTGDIDYTFSCWVYLESDSDSRWILSKFNTNNAGSEYALYYDSGLDKFVYVCYLGSTRIELSNTLNPTTGAWYHIVCWHDATANTVNISVNNNTAASQTTSGAAPNDTAATFNLGARNGVLNFDGLIDEVGFWKRVLTSDERTTLYNSGNGLEYPFSIGLPKKPDLVTLDFAYQGRPFCFVEAKSGQNTTSLDFAYQGRPFVGAAAEATNHALAGNAIATASPSVALPSLSQGHSLSATATSPSAPSVGLASLSQLHALVATSVIAGAPVAGAPSLSQLQVMTANNAAVAAPVVGQPSLNQSHALNSQSLSALAGAVDVAAISQTHAFATSEALTGEPNAGQAGIQQLHVMNAASISMAVALGQPNLTQAQALSGNTINAGTPSFGSVDVSQSHPFVAVGISSEQGEVDSPVLLQQHVLAAGSVNSEQPTLGSVLAGQSHSVSATDVLSGVPSLAAGVLSQSQSIIAASLLSGNPTLSQPELPGPSLTAAQVKQIADVWRRLGLDVANPLTTSEVEVVAGSVLRLVVTGTTSVTVTRQASDTEVDTAIGSMLTDIWRRLGLDSANPLVSSASQISSGGLVQSVTATANTVVTARQS